MPEKPPCRGAKHELRTFGYLTTARLPKPLYDAVLKASPIAAALSIG
jgi:hypothetical protein